MELFPKIAIYQWNDDIIASTAVRHEPSSFFFSFLPSKTFEVRASALRRCTMKKYLFRSTRGRHIFHFLEAKIEFTFFFRAALKCCASRIQVLPCTYIIHSQSSSLQPNVLSDSFPHFSAFAGAYLFYDCFDRYTQTPFRKNNYIVCCSWFTTIFSPFSWPKSLKRK